MQITAKKLVITNFKGLKNFSINFNHETNIYGANAKGKTTIVDAFFWLFFNKNSDGETKFNIKPIKPGTNDFIKDLIVSVELIFDLDGMEISARRELSQNWKTRRGSLDKDYVGDVSSYYWNGTPLIESEFKKKVAGVIDETLFKLITNPLYFNDLHWTERRKTLLEMAGNITKNDILKVVVGEYGEELFTDLIAAFAQNKSVDEYKKELNEASTKTRKDAENIPIRIDQINKNMPKVLDWQALESRSFEIEKQLAEKNKLSSSTIERLNAKQNSLLTATRNYQNELNTVNEKVFKLQTAIQKRKSEVELAVKNNHGQEQKELDAAIKTKSQDEETLTKFENLLQTYKDQAVSLEDRLNKKRVECNEIGAEEFEMKEGDCNCPTCLQELPADKLEETKTKLSNRFYEKRLERFQAAEKEGMTLKKELELLNDRIKSGESQISTTKEKIKTLDAMIEKLQALVDAADKVDLVKAIAEAQKVDETLINLKQDLTEAEESATEIESRNPANKPKEESTDDTREDEEAKKTLATEIKILTDELKEVAEKLATKKEREKLEKNIVELTDEESELAQRLAKIEGNLHAIMLYNKAHMKLVDDRINDKFKYVRFKMFNELNSGGTEETCETLVSSNGAYVNFKNTNTAARINAGIDIINALCQHYDKYAPIFIDNRESVIDLIESESQVINLFVSEGVELSVGVKKYADKYEAKQATLL